MEERGAISKKFWKDDIWARVAYQKLVKKYSCLSGYLIINR